MTKDYKTLQIKLDEIINQLQSEDVDIDEAITLYKDAQKLITQIEDYLKTAKNQVEQLKNK